MYISYYEEKRKYKDCVMYQLEEDEWRHTGEETH